MSQQTARMAFQCFLEDPDRTGTGMSYNPKITKVEGIIDGIRNQQFSQDMHPHQQWYEIN